MHLIQCCRTFYWWFCTCTLKLLKGVLLPQSWTFIVTSFFPHCNFMGCVTASSVQHCCTDLSVMTSCWKYFFGSRVAQTGRMLQTDLLDCTFLCSGSLEEMPSHSFIGKLCQEVCAFLEKGLGQSWEMAVGLNSTTGELLMCISRTPATLPLQKAAVSF